MVVHLLILAALLAACRSSPPEPPSPPSRPAAPPPPHAEAPPIRDPIHAGRLAGPFASLEEYCAAQRAAFDRAACTVTSDGGAPTDVCRCDTAPAPGTEARALPADAAPVLAARFFENTRSAREPARWSLGLRTSAGWFVYADLAEHRAAPGDTRATREAAIEALTTRRTRDGGRELVVMLHEDRVNTGNRDEDPMAGHRTTVRSVVLCRVYEQGTPWCSNKTPPQAL